ncbi:MAG: PfkB family carbohydrate kinase [bacterium]
MYSNRAQITVVGAACAEFCSEGGIRTTNAADSRSDSFLPGGMAVRVALALSRMGCRVFFLSCVGTDTMGARILTELHKNRVNVDFVERRRDEQTTVIAMKNFSGSENFQIVSSGASSVMSRASLLSARAMVSSCDLMVILSDIPAEIFAFAIDVAHHFHVPVMVYPNQSENVSRGILMKIEILVADRTGAGSLIGSKVNDLNDTAACLHLFMKHGVGAALVVAAGSGVAGMMQGGEPFYAPAPRVSGGQVWENSVLLSYLARLLSGGVRMRDACFIASAAAAGKSVMSFEL